MSEKTDRINEVIGATLLYVRFSTISKSGKNLRTYTYHWEKRLYLYTKERRIEADVDYRTEVYFTPEGKFELWKYKNQPSIGWTRQFRGKMLSPEKVDYSKFLRAIIVGVRKWGRFMKLKDGEENPLVHKVRDLIKELQLQLQKNKLEF